MSGVLQKLTKAAFEYFFTSNKQGSHIRRIFINLNYSLLSLRVIKCVFHNMSTCLTLVQTVGEVNENVKYKINSKHRQHFYLLCKQLL